MSLKRILVVNKKLHPAAVELLQKCKNVQMTVLPYSDEHPDIMPAIKRSLAEGYDGLIWNTKYILSPQILDIAGPQLKAVTTVSSGLDHVDVKELQKRGIPLGCAKSALGNAVADIAVGLLIAAARRFKEGVAEIHSGSWQVGIQMLLGQDITGSTVGIVGLGNIGQTIVRRLTGFDVAKFLYSGRKEKSEAKQLNAERVSLNQLLQESDYVILCCPLSEETKHLINAENIKLMKKNSILINIARGEVIDQEALYDALKEKCIFGAALDVTTPEPLPKDHKLLQLPNCYIIPHMGSATFETRKKMAELAARNILLGLEGKFMECPAY